MKFRMVIIIGLVALVAAIAVIALIATQLTPQATNPAFTAAVDFVNAAGAGDDTTALALLDEEMRAYVAENCPNGSPSACIQSYAAPDWGKLVTAVFRRAAPDGTNWDVEVIAHHETSVGASGICSMIRVAPNGENWQVAGWAGFIHCGEPQSRDMATNPDTPNRAP
jgi:hypothetical protein